MEFQCVCAKQNISQLVRLRPKSTFKDFKKGSYDIYTCLENVGTQFSSVISTIYSVDMIESGLKFFFL